MHLIRKLNKNKKNIAWSISAMNARISLKYNSIY